MDIYQTLLGTAWLVLLLCSVDGYIMHIDAHAEECFFDKVTSGTKMSLMFEVAEGGFLDIDVQVCGMSQIDSKSTTMRCA